MMVDERRMGGGPADRVFPAISGRVQPDEFNTGRSDTSDG